MPVPRVIRRMSNSPVEIRISYDPARVSGRLILLGNPSSSVWDRLRGRALADQTDSVITDHVIEVPWPKVLGILREYGSRQQQKNLNFRFVPRPIRGPTNREVFDRGSSCNSGAEGGRNSGKMGRYPLQTAKVGVYEGALSSFFSCEILKGYSRSPTARISLYLGQEKPPSHWRSAY